MVVALAVLGVQHVHTEAKVKALRANPNLRLLGAFESSAELRAKRMAQGAFAGVHWFSSAEELLAAEGLQGVIIDGLPRQNMALAALALEAGKPILLEKPAGTQPGEFEGLLAEAQASNLYVSKSSWR